MPRKRIAWVSANKFGYSLLKEAVNIENFEIVSIFTLRKGARTIMYDGIDMEKWKKFHIPIHEIDDINDEISVLKEMQLDFLFVCGWRQIINENILSIPKKGVVGFHPSLLPRGRGPAPIINTILSGFSESGLTMFYLARGLDNGDIIAQEKFPITDNDYANDVYNKNIRAGRKLIKKYLPLLGDDLAPRRPQKNDEATVFPKRSLKDNEFYPILDSPDEIYKKIRAFSKPYSGAFFIKDNKKITIWKADMEDITVLKNNTLGGVK